MRLYLYPKLQGMSYQLCLIMQTKVSQDFISPRLENQVTLFKYTHYNDSKSSSLEYEKLILIGSHFFFFFF